MKYYFLGLATILVVCVGCAGLDGQQHFEKNQYFAPPPAMLQRPGPMVDGPGPGVIPMMNQPMGVPGAVMPPSGPHGPNVQAHPQNTQVKFVGPAGMSIGWKAGEIFAENQLITPGRYDFARGGTYQLKLTGIPDREETVLYPTLQVRPGHPSIDAYLAHNSVPVELTDEDFDQVASNNYVTKVIYLPDARHQELAIAGVETLVSTRLDPGVDPVAEAQRRGTVMLVLRIGNKDLEMPGSIPAGPAVNGVSSIRQASHMVIDGMQDQFVPPMPIAVEKSQINGIPPAMIVAGSGPPGQSPYPIAGVGPTPSWGTPSTMTPIGLPGPPALPMGGPASLTSHTLRNRTKTDLPKPVDNLLIDVKHEPGYRLPHPVKHIQYTEKHPVYRPGEVAYPAHKMPPRIIR